MILYYSQVFSLLRSSLSFYCVLQSMCYRTRFAKHNKLCEHRVRSNPFFYFVIVCAKHIFAKNRKELCERRRREKSCTEKIGCAKTKLGLREGKLLDGNFRTNLSHLGGDLLSIFFRDCLFDRFWSFVNDGFSLSQTQTC
jgi:hypothetical protein